MSKQENKVWVLRTKEEELKQRAESAEAELLRTRVALGALVSEVAEGYILMHMWERPTDEYGQAVAQISRAIAKAEAALSKAPQPQEEAKHE